jgi:8-oxo-dGTP pyrophosphatase MutT (NUDIX family)
MANDPFLNSRERLVVGNAVAALIVVENGRYLLQRRDRIEDIWYPDHWGLFGGAIEPGEDPEQALARELLEELEFRFSAATLFARFDFNLHGLGLATYFRAFYVVPMSESDLAGLVLREGSDVCAVAGKDALTMRLTPYDAFALFLHSQRERIG